ncbi:hypothetical protein Dxin01_00092 [Deinococcus xinjiangensis]|uniref:4Fe-4S ferredoxin-type domain-containing protein n=1 Tax=Deinococcus xinjiangensis TaxID=457454 RepID=A0ABP9V540_9DEIO
MSELAEIQQPTVLLKDPCQMCGADEGEPPHLCPYAEDIYRGDERCNCCDACTRECAADI